MGLFKREPIYLTCLLIVALASAEGWVAWRYLRGNPLESRSRIAQLEREVKAKQAEINHLIFLRDAEHRLAQAVAARARASSLAQSLAPPSNEDELAQATAQALAAPVFPDPGAGPRRDPRRDQAARLPGLDELKALRAGLPGAPLSPSLDPQLLEDEDQIPSPQGAAPREKPDASAELTPADIDPKHLVNMANIMTGKPVAELTRMKGQPLIRYKTTRLKDDDPIWHLLDAVGQARALGEVVLVGKSAGDAKSLAKLSDTLTSSGVPSKLIHIKAGDPEYAGLEGILITLLTGKEGSKQ
jgi:hypothetical protein